jgi:hypothetical protein
MKREEWISIFTISVVVGFLFSFNQILTAGAGSTYALQVVLVNAILAFVVFYVSYKIQHWFLERSHVHSEITVSMTATVFSILLNFATNGVLIFFVPPLVRLTLPGYSGTDKNHGSMHHAYKPLIYSVMALVILGLIIGMTGTYWAINFQRMAYLTALFSLIPLDFLLKIKEKHIGNSVGSILLYDDKYSYVFLLLFVLLAAMNRYFNNVVFAVLFALIAAWLLKTVYYIQKEINAKDH